MEQIRCKFSKVIYRSNDGGFTVAIYKPVDDDIADASLKAVSYATLPTTPGIMYTLSGEWSTRKNKEGDYEKQFNVVTYDEQKPDTMIGVMKYLESLSGVGKVTAKKIYAKFGNDSVKILSENPEKLLEVDGIREKTVTKISASLLEKGVGKDLFIYLYSFGINSLKIYKIYEEFKEKSVEKVKSKPYDLIELAGIGFNTAEKIARGNNLPLNSTDRIKAGINEVLLQAEISAGHTHLSWQGLCKSLNSLLSLSIPYSDIAKLCMEMVNDKKLFIGSKNFFYRFSSYLAEYGTAKELLRLLKPQFPQKCYDKEIAEASKLLKIKLDKSQEEAINLCLNNPVTIITGGPGTGKTLIERILLDVYTKLYPFNSVKLCAPTGRASRRMSEATGRPSSTIHQALGLYAQEGDTFLSNKTPEISDDLILIDEVSMLDSYLANALLKAIKSGSQVVLIGDANQLPSVGPGCVLREIIESKLIPMVSLTKIFRQKNGSSIAINSARVNNGTTILEFDEDFTLIEAQDDEEELLKKIIEVYKEETSRVGLDNVTVLSPFRVKTKTGVDNLNPTLREIVNLPSPNTPHIKTGKHTLYKGDKVMETKNREVLANGDIGYVQNIYRTDENLVLNVDYGFAQAEYESEDVMSLDLAYATTVHKSQGSEYKSVIFICTEAHSVLLKRNLVYTAISRAKENLIIIGSKAALDKGIKTEDTSKRNSRLSEILLHLNDKKESVVEAEEKKSDQISLFN